ncbi:MAG TPA: Clp protease N-terminal domain-containing protein [Acidimicrobiales bacterium]|jgi:hypothetical protein|nr:Clp protease N-terminal domain-containing protein [Acidimicrobiales bacterium]
MTPAPSLQELIDTVGADATGPKPLEQLVQASRTVGQLEETSDALLGYFVDRCRRQGHSWSEISAALGVTKQAAHKRFAPSPSGAPTFERFTVKARFVVGAAADQARMLGQAQVTPEHLLLALFRPEDSLAARALADSGITLPMVLSATGSGVVEAGEPAAPQSESREATPFTAATIELLRRAVVEALQLGHNYIGTEHLLLALSADPPPAAEAVGLDRDRIEALVGEYLHSR